MVFGAERSALAEPCWPSAAGAPYRPPPPTADGWAAAGSTAAAVSCQPPGNVGAVGALKLLAGRTNVAPNDDALSSPPPPAPPPPASAPAPAIAGPAAAAVGPSAAASVAPRPELALLNGPSMLPSRLGPWLASCGKALATDMNGCTAEPACPARLPALPSIEDITLWAGELAAVPPATGASAAVVIVWPAA